MQAWAGKEWEQLLLKIQGFGGSLRPQIFLKDLRTEQKKHFKWNRQPIYQQLLIAWNIAQECVVVSHEKFTTAAFFLIGSLPSMFALVVYPKSHAILQRFNVKSKGCRTFSWTSGPRHVCTLTCHVTWKEVLLHFRFVRVIHGFHGDKLGMSAVLNQLHSSFEACGFNSRFN